jgi:RNase P/RNase MRP subunit POP5|tara:strand:- start:6759 stop:7037 length:279 start_codon:yes stop_codon:yes gene_type:complete
MKPLKPSAKENKRYLFVKGKNLKTNIPKSVRDFIGVLGMSEASLNVVKSGKDWAIISVNRKSMDKVRASLAVWPDKMSVEKVSGTLKGLGKV